jgi:hypothetical protein
MSEQESERPRGIGRLLEDFQAAALAPLNAIPEIRDSETLRKAAEQVQQSQRDLIESLKDAYPMIASDYAEKQRQKELLAQAKAELDAAEDTVKTARSALQQACVAAVSTGISEDAVSAMADVSSITLQRWKEEAAEVDEVAKEASEAVADIIEGGKADSSH